MSDQIKMFIAGEEVVSQNEFTINEEMLSASSTILNNCYPKSWELTKDYISNFYYPKDYSRFVLAQGEYLHGNQEFQPLEITSKNLLDGIFRQGNVNGNASVATQIFDDSNYYVIKNTNYTISTNIDTTTYKYQIFVNDKPFPKSNTDYEEYTSGWKTTSTFSFNINVDGYMGVGIVRVDGGNLTPSDISNVWFQLEEGNQATTYEPYNQPTMYYKTNIEKEWDSFNIYGNTYQATRSGKNLCKPIATATKQNMTFTNNGDGSYTLNGTAQANTSFYITGLNYPAGTYTFCANNPTTNSNGAFYFQAEPSASGRRKTFTEINAKMTFTIDTAITAWVVVVPSGLQLNNFVIRPQLEAGNQATEFEAYGVQPSPEYPSELVSVGYENLFDIPNGTKTSSGLTATIQDGIVSVSGTSTATSFLMLVQNTFSLKAGTYTISAFNPSTYNDNQFDLRITGKNGVGILGRTYLNVANSSTTFTLSEDLEEGCIQVRASSGDTLTNFIVKPQLTKGAQAHSYIPYGKYGVEVKTTGKNLFDKNNIIVGKYIDANGNFVNDSNNFIGDFIKINNTDSYYISASAGQAKRIAYYDSTHQFISRQLISTIGSSLTIPNNTQYLRISSYNVLLNTLQLEKGTQATGYEPYKSNNQLYVLNEPLRAIGNVKDELYIENGTLKVERKIGKAILDGSSDESYSRVVVNDVVVFINNSFTNIIRKSATIINVMSDYFTGIADSSGNIANTIRSNNSAQLFITIPSSNSITESTTTFKTWLSTHNTEVQYILAEPYTEELGQVQIPYSYVGVNNVNIYTGLNARSTIWYYWKNYDVLFAGVVKNSGDISLNPRHPHYCSLQILDYKTFLSESNTLDFVIANKTVSEAINMVVNAVSGYGFIVGNINIDSADDIIGAYSTLNKTAYDVLQYLAEISGSRWRTRVVDSLTMAIDFYDPDNLPQADDIEYTKEYWEENNIVDMTFNYGTRDYRNKQILLSDEVYANINYEETLISNGYSNTFTVQNNIGDIVSIIVDGAEKTVGTNNDKQMGVEADFYYTPGKNIVESNSVYSAGTMIHLTYQPLVKGRQVVYNNNEIDRISQQTQTNGVIARYETRNDVLSSDELEKIAKTYIEYKGKAEVILTLTTQNKDLYDIGEVVYFNAPISDLAQNYMVKSKKTECVVIDKIINLFYVYEMTSSFNSEKAINYFDNQRSKATGNIEEGESITRNVDIETEANIIWSNGNVSSATVTVTGDNILNCALNSPFVE